MSVLANTTSGLIIFNNPHYEPQRWHMTLLLIGYTLTMTVLNLGVRRVLNPLENIGGVLHILLFIAIVAILTSMSPRSSSKFVFNTLTTNSGWDNPGVAWSIGLLTTAYPISSFDSVLHMSRLSQTGSSLTAKLDISRRDQRATQARTVCNGILNDLKLYYDVCVLHLLTILYWRR